MESLNTEDSLCPLFPGGTEARAFRKDGEVDEGQFTATTSLGSLLGAGHCAELLLLLR